MPSIRKKGRTFFACITLADGTRTQLSTHQKDTGAPAERAEARRRAQQIAAFYEEQARGNATEAQIRHAVGSLFKRITGRRLSFAQTDNFLHEWLVRVKHRKASKTFLRYEKVLRDFLASLGPKAARPLDDITPQDVQRFCDAELAAKRPTTVRLIIKVLNTPFNQALRQGLIPTNPVAAADIPTGATESRHPLTWPQVAALLAAASGEWRTVILLGVFTGARLGDCVAMRKVEIDLTQRTLRFRPAKTRASGKEVVVPLHPTLEAHLLTLPNDSAEEYLSPALARVPMGGRSGLSRQFRAIMKSAGIEEPPAPPAEPGRRRISRLCFHSLRHTFNTMLADAGVPAETRMALSGHASARMNETYTHRGLELLRSAVVKLPALTP